MSKLELRIPPVGISLLFAAAMWLVSAFTPAYSFDPAFRLVVIALLMAAAAVFGLGGILSFKRAGTTVNPLDPEKSASLVSSGVYRFSRNPMYLALLLVLLALGVFLANVNALVIAALFVPYMNRFQIGPEERAMEKLFEPQFQEYCASVRRWI
ncbi:MAG: isoprenylcysteine carboxylmethyltransferase family protein [Xanthomonadales bacterium]|jgi:protein-S-isoprenylcysteine O-methyltransferase Ste14|nr:isoprenylcysteine carboxylmethyltransferase family protein [Xanthomonadales bacterium]